MSQASHLLPARAAGFRLSAVLLAAGGALLLAPCVIAQTTFYWDRNGATAGAGTGAILNGTWNTTTANWSTSSAGNTATTTFTSGGNAVFSAGTSATGQTYTITVSGTQNTSSITVEEGTVTFSGGTAINFNDSTPDFTVNSGLTTTVNTNITGSNGLNKLGAGTLVFATNDKSYTGTTTISAGTLQLNFNQSFSTVALAGGTLRLSSATTTITTLNVTANSTIDFGGAAATLNLTTLNISAGVTLSIINWVNASDFFMTQNWTRAGYDTTGASPMNQVVFSGYTASDTRWLSYEDSTGSGYHQITPVPEPRTFGAALVAAGLCLGWWRRRIRHRAA
jgi:autotransporter-associated beta strand protein